MNTLEEEYKMKLEDQAEYDKKKAVLESKVSSAGNLILKVLDSMSVDEKTWILAVDPEFTVEDTMLMDLMYVKQVCARLMSIKIKLEEMGFKLLREGENVLSKS